MVQPFYTKYRKILIAYSWIFMNMTFESKKIITKLFSPVSHYRESLHYKGVKSKQRIWVIVLIMRLRASASLLKQPLCRSLYTHVKETGIPGYDKNRKIFESQRQGKSLPSWLENNRTVNQEEVEELYKAFPAFVQDLMTLPCTKDLPLGNLRLRNMTEHLVPWAPTTAVQAIAVDRFYVERARRKNEEIKDMKNHTFLVHKLAWSLEMICRNVGVVDDLIDGSDMRNGLPTWHSLPNIGSKAINDAGALVFGGVLVLDRYFKVEDYYIELVRFVHETMHAVAVSTSELFEMNATRKREGKKQGLSDPSSSMKKLLDVKRVLNARVGLHLPVIGTMIMHRVRDPVLINKAYEIGHKVFDSGIMVDDWIDCYGTTEVIEREASDIQNGRQTWLIYKPMELGSPEQCQRLVECYGKKDAKYVDEVKDIYRQLNIKKVVSKMAEDTAKDLEAEIMALPQDDLPCSVWLNMLNHYRDTALGKAARP